MNSDVKNTRSSSRWRPSLRLRSALGALYGIGLRRLEIYREVGICRVLDLLIFPPRRYLEFPAPVPIAGLFEGDECSIRGRLLRKSASSRRRRAALTLRVGDDSGEVDALLFGPGYLLASFGRGEPVGFKGLLEVTDGARRFRVAEFVRGEDLPAEPSAFRLPQYSLPASIPPRVHRRSLRTALEHCTEELKILPVRAATVHGEHELRWDLALRWLHFPPDTEQARRARAFLVGEEAVRAQVSLLRLRRSLSIERDRPYRDVDGSLERFLAVLPFELTKDQRQAIEELRADLKGPVKMTRLLSGDVGSGKTAVELALLFVAALCGRQAALLAPTEILARQHYLQIEELGSRLGLERPVLLSGDELAPRRLEEPVRAPLLVGTHRLFSEKLKIPELSAVVVDEQHKFGVRQRFSLWSKGQEPDLLLASATPIPRTLALTLLGHLDLSVLERRPFGAPCVETVLRSGREKRAVPEEIRGELARGGKILVVCPAIQESVTGVRALPAAETVGAWLSEKLVGQRVEVLHGRMSTESKWEIIERFKSGVNRVLVTTVVVEVGVDVPDASMVVILGADRFGLCQLHQIRGRVGRRGEAARCLVVSSEPGERAQKRLSFFAETLDGFRLAEFDLLQRGPGEVLGLRQHGRMRWVYPELWTDLALMQAAKAVARSWWSSCNSLPSNELDAPRVASQSWIW